MEKRKRTVNLVAKIVVGATFLGVFLLNALMFVNTEGSGFSIESLKAYAQTGGANNEEEPSLGVEDYVENTEITTQSCPLPPVWDEIEEEWVSPGYGEITETCLIRSCLGSGTVSCVVANSCNRSPCQ